MKFKEWQNAYRNKKIFDIFSEFTENEIKILEKLGIIIENKVYTEYEYTNFKLELNNYIIEGELDEEDWEYVKFLSDKDVAKKDFDKIKKKFDEIDEKYKNKINKLNF